MRKAVLPSNRIVVEQHSTLWRFSWQQPRIGEPEDNQLEINQLKTSLRYWREIRCAANKMDLSVWRMDTPNETGRGKIRGKGDGVNERDRIGLIDRSFPQYARIRERIYENGKRV
ncbi:hypothetical protein HZH66_009676 [Vespula vulgaris]|uniref:Uncharacterized protein n=1 Tax=Vespula vulgaris TaxID=7454 RepID=A0A834JPG4_VESVU|nr:hypothetical protein HZH66_009676 [Vespula vulgaris]